MKNQNCSIINLSQNAPIPEGWTRREEDQIPYRVCEGEMPLAEIVSRISLFFAKEQRGWDRIQGLELQKKLEGQLVLGANVLDALLANPEYIPEAWKGRGIFFFGDVYRDREGNLVVRYLYWCGSHWYWSYRYLGSRWGADSPVAVLVSE